MSQSDTLLRAMTDDGAFRVMAARTTDTVRGVIRAQQAIEGTARLLGDLVTGAVLFRETMAPQLRVQTIIRDGTDSLVADSHPSGATRGLVQLPEGRAQVELSGQTVLQMMRSLPSGQMQQGIVPVPAQGDVSQAMMAYMQTSEQVTSMLALATTFQDGEVLGAGGYLVQLLPEVGRGPLMVMTERLRDYEAIDHLINGSFSPMELLDELLHGMPYTKLGESEVRFECWCSELSLVSALSTLPRKQIEELIADGAFLEINCDYCRREYRISPATLRGLIKES